MLNRIASVIGWIGTVLVFGSVGLRIFRPEWNQYAYYGAWAGLACVLLYMASQWRDIAHSFSRRQARMGTIPARRSSSCWHCWSPSTTWPRAATSGGT